MKSKNKQSWTSTKFSKTLMMDALFKHLLGLMLYRMTDLGEVFEVMGQVKPNDEECWIESWKSMASKIQTRAEQAENAGKTKSAAGLYLRASTYWRASLMYFSHSKDSRITKHSMASSECYEKYLKLSGYPGQSVKIPYEGTFLRGHFYRSPSADAKAPVLILTPGRDTWAEDTYWVFDEALKRGIHCLTYDGPGQGYALRLDNLKFRYDWENVMKPVVDFALEQPGIDSSRLGIMGLSFGGFLSIRSAAFEKRIKICVTDPETVSWGHSIINHFPKPLGGIVSGKSSDFLRKISISALDRAPMISWLIRDYAWKHGVPNEDVFKTLLDFDNTKILEIISCKTLVMDGTEEMARGQAEKLFNALKCPKEYMLFDESSTAQAHCQIGAYSTASARLMDWLEDNL